MVYVFHSAMTGAPALSGQAGKLIDVLDACLINGWGSGTVDSVVIAGGIATVTRAAGHPFEVDSVALIAGATVSGGSINGDKKVLSATSTTYTFDATGISNQSATGTITHKVAPLGWAKTYSGTNLAAYKPSDVAATGCLLRVDDTGGADGRVVGYETMSDINTGTGPFPTAAQMSGGAYWHKSGTADATARSWVLIGDSRGFVLQTTYAGTLAVSMWFGDFASRKTPDARCSLAGLSSAVASSSATTNDLFYVTDSANVPMWAPRGVSGLGSAVAMRRGANVVYGSGTATSGNGALAYPNAADNAFLLSPIALTEGACYRGDLPGVYFCPQALGTVFASRDKIEGISGLLGRKVMALVGGWNGTGCGFVDITGPWAR